MANDTPRLTLGNLRPPRGSRAAPKRKGRGPGSGTGKTAGRGHKGQGSRTSGNVRPGFEGGQMPLVRRVPKRGFVNPFREPAQAVNLYALARLPEDSEVTPETLLGVGLVRRTDRPVKLLAQGDPGRAYVVRGVGCSKAARAKLEAAGGRIED